MSGAHRSPQPALATACVFSWLICGLAAAAEAQVRYLADDAVDRIMDTVQDWGVLGLNRVAHPPNRKPNRLRIKNTSYDRGLGCHTNGEVLVELGGAFKTFQADVGVQWQGGKTGPTTQGATERSETLPPPRDQRTAHREWEIGSCTIDRLQRRERSTHPADANVSRCPGRSAPAYRLTLARCG